jgi:hypothetical protein
MVRDAELDSYDDLTGTFACLVIRVDCFQEKRPGLSPMPDASGERRHHHLGQVVARDDRTFFIVLDHLGDERCVVTFEIEYSENGSSLDGALILAGSSQHRRQNTCADDRGTPEHCLQHGVSPLQ